MDADVLDSLSRIKQALRHGQHADRALSMQAYLKNQFAFLGLPAPVRRQAIAVLGPLVAKRQDLLSLAAVLWEQKEREYKYTALDLLWKYRGQLVLGDLPWLLELAQSEPWWETVDGLAKIMGVLVRSHSKERLETMAWMDTCLESESLWIRRIAMTHQLGWRLETDEVWLFAAALKLSGEKEPFIRKAIGWALRDYAKWNPEAVRWFLQGPGRQLSALSQREAIKRL